MLGIGRKASHTASQTGAPLPPDGRRLRVGVVGAGHFGRFHALKAASAPRAHLVGIADPDVVRAAEVATEASRLPSDAPVNVLDYDALIAATEAIIIAAPAAAHFDLAARALSAGRHVLVEKPIAATLAEADELTAIAAASDRVLQVGHLLRYSAEHAAISARMRRPLYIEATRIAPFKPRGTDVSVILDLMIHDLDLVLAIVDSPIEMVDAIGAAVTSPHEDIANARVRFANGCVATITASRISLKTERRMRLFSEEGYLSADFGARELTMIGREAGIPLPGTGGFRREVVNWQDHDTLAAEHEAFYAACLDGAPVIVNALAGRRALEAALAVTDGITQARLRMERSGLIAIGTQSMPTDRPNGF